MPVQDKSLSVESNKIDRIFKKKGVYSFLHIVILALSVFLVVCISIDTFHNEAFYKVPKFMKFQFWVCVIFLLDFLLSSSYPLISGITYALTLCFSLSQFRIMPLSLLTDGHSVLKLPTACATYRLSEEDMQCRLWLVGSHTTRPRGCLCLILRLSFYGLFRFACILFV